MANVEYADILGRVRGGLNEENLRVLPLSRCHGEYIIYLL